MARLSERHEKLDANGVGLCSVPMWFGYGGEAGFCDEPAYGVRPPTRFRTRWDGYESADDGGPVVHAGGLSCPKHGGPKVPPAVVEAQKVREMVDAFKPLADAANAVMAKIKAEPFIDVVFDGPPGPESGRFVECEDETGRSINAGEWIDRGNGLWALRIKPPSVEVK